MILILSVVLFRLFLNVLLSFKGVGRKIFGRSGQKEHQDREIAPISLPSFYQWRVRGRTRHAPRAHLKGTLHSRAPCKK